MFKCLLDGGHKAARDSLSKVLFIKCFNLKKCGMIMESYHAIYRYLKKMVVKKQILKRYYHIRVMRTMMTISHQKAN
jgi:hypothetical protein